MAGGADNSGRLIDGLISVPRPGVYPFFSRHDSLAFSSLLSFLFDRMRSDLDDSGGLMMCPNRVCVCVGVFCCIWASRSPQLWCFLPLDLLPVWRPAEPGRLIFAFFLSPKLRLMEAEGWREETAVFLAVLVSTSAVGLLADIKSVRPGLIDGSLFRFRSTGQLLFFCWVFCFSSWKAKWCLSLGFFPHVHHWELLHLSFSFDRRVSQRWKPVMKSQSWREILIRQIHFCRLHCRTAFFPRVVFLFFNWPLLSETIFVLLKPIDLTGFLFCLVSGQCCRRVTIEMSWSDCVAHFSPLPFRFPPICLLCRLDCCLLVVTPGGSLGQKCHIWASLLLSLVFVPLIYLFVGLLLTCCQVQMGILARIITVGWQLKCQETIPSAWQAGQLETHSDGLESWVKHNNQVGLDGDSRAIQTGLFDSLADCFIISISSGRRKEVWLAESVISALTRSRWLHWSPINSSSYPGRLIDGVTVRTKVFSVVPHSSEVAELPVLSTFRFRLMWQLCRWKAKVFATLHFPLL